MLVICVSKKTKDFEKSLVFLLTLDNNVLILALVFLFEGVFTTSVFSIMIYALMMLLSVLNLSSISTPKFGGKWVYALVSYVIIMTSVFGWILWHKL
jgi:CDP-diacylglycerol--serine O-phosphatidyltransferase